MKRYKLLTVSMMAAALVAGCGDDQPAPAPPAASQVVAKPPAQTVAPPAAEAPKPPEEVRYVYPVEGRRDPFMPITGVRVATVMGNPLESFDVPQYLLKGLLIGLGEPRAVLMAPDGKSYIVRKGTRLGKNNGVIRDITRERILIEERYQDVTGTTRTNIQEIKVPKREGV
jgi:type IV pilus assembly protein PilP